MNIYVCNLGIPGNPGLGCPGPQGTPGPCSIGPPGQPGIPGKNDDVCHSRPKPIKGPKISLPPSSTIEKLVVDLSKGIKCDPTKCPVCIFNFIHIILLEILQKYL